MSKLPQFEYQTKIKTKAVFLNAEELKDRLKAFLPTKGVNPLETDVFRYSDIYGTNQIDFKVKNGSLLKLQQKHETIFVMLHFLLLFCYHFSSVFLYIFLYNYKVTIILYK